MQNSPAISAHSGPVSDSYHHLLRPFLSLSASILMPPKLSVTVFHPKQSWRQVMSESDMEAQWFSIVKHEHIYWSCYLNAVFGSKVYGIKGNSRWLMEVNFSLHKSLIQTKPNTRKLFPSTHKTQLPPSLKAILQSACPYNL